MEPFKEIDLTEEIVGKKRGRKLTEEKKYKNDSEAKIKEWRN